MSYESESVIAPRTGIEAVREFVGLLGYVHPRLVKFGSDRFEEFLWFDPAAYRSWSGVELAIYRNQENRIVVSTRTPIGRSYYDLVHQNDTISALRRRFGGSFRTDEGAGKFLRPGSPPPSPPASGCHLAFERFGMNLIKASVCHQARVFPHSPERRLKDLKGIEFMAEIDPRTLANNTMVPFLVAALEDYFKSTFVALLTYSPNKAAFLKGVRLQGDQLLAVAGGKTVEGQIAETLPFQRPTVICQHFAALDSRLDIAGTLRKPYHRRAQSLFDSIDSLVLGRHEFIHRATLDLTMSDDKLHGLIQDLDVATTRVYRRITDHYDWVFDRGWHMGRRRQGSLSK